MAKRNAPIRNLATKKIKIDDFDDSWEEELDERVIEDCLKRATQADPQTNHDISLSYSFFKQPKHQIMTSTQQYATQDTLEDKLKVLQSKCAEKEGEVSILRTKLQDLQASNQLEHDKHKSEWSEKLHLTEKENKAAKAEVEFKNLEIAQLKQQITKLSKMVSAEQISTQLPKMADLNIMPRLPENESNDSNFKISISSETVYPLRCVRFSNFSLTLSPNTTTNNIEFYENTEFKLRKSRVINVNTSININNHICSEKRYAINVLCPELTYLCNLSEDDLDLDATIPSINKVVNVSTHLLSDLLSYLEHVQTNIQIEDILEIEETYLKKSCWANTSQIGIDCSEVLEFLAILIPFSSYLRKVLFENQSLRTNSDLVKLDSTLELHHMELIRKIISIIGKTKREHMCTRFLSSVLKLISKASSVGCYSNIITQIIQEILFLQPHLDVILQITIFLKEASKHPTFMRAICFNSKTKFVKKDGSKGVFYFNKDVCRLSIFLSILQISLETAKNENEKFCLKICSNVLDFMYNIFGANSAWLDQPENKSCECLTKLCKFVIRIIYENSQSQRHKTESIHKRSIKILHLMSFDLYNLIQKYVIVLAQFKESVYNLIQFYEDSKKLKGLEKLIVENCAAISSEKFVGLDF